MIFLPLPSLLHYSLSLSPCMLKPLDPSQMIGTLTAFQWLLYDSFKVTLGLPTTGGH